MAIDLSGYDPWSSIGGDMSGATSTGGNSASSMLGLAGSFFGPVGSVVGSALGGLFGGGNDKEAARKQLRLQKQQMAMQKDLAYNGMQIRSKDLLAAGLNPMLAGMNQQGASASSVAMPQLMPTGAAKAASAQRGAEVGNATALTAAAIMKSNAEAKLATAQAAEVEARIPTYQSSISRNTAEIEALAVRNKLTAAETQNAIRTWENIVQDTDLKLAQKLKIILHENPKLDTETGKIYIEALLRNAELPMAENTAAMGRTPFGRALPYVQEGGKVLDKLIPSYILPYGSKFPNSARKGATK